MYSNCTRTCLKYIYIRQQLIRQQHRKKNDNRIDNIGHYVARYSDMDFCYNDDTCRYNDLGSNYHYDYNNIE